MLEGVLKVHPVCSPQFLCLVSILGMLEGVLKVLSLTPFYDFALVSILGMLEGVLKACVALDGWKTKKSFNPWYVGGGVKSLLRNTPHIPLSVSILGMLEGVLKE